MKILDRYVARNFLTGYLVAFCVLMGLRVMLDLFVNIDEFTEHSDLGVLSVLKNIAVFYGTNLTLYYRDFAGMIMVVAASFSLGKMVRNHELVAIMVSGVSLRRVIAPIFFLGVICTGVLIVNQEYLIPPLSDRLVRSHDDLPGEENYDVWFLDDGNGSLICSPKFDVKTAKLYKPMIVLREKKEDKLYWTVSGRIDAEKASYDRKRGGWVLEDGRLMRANYEQGIRDIDFYASDLKPKDIPVRQQAGNLSLLSLRQITKLSENAGNVRDMATLLGQKQFRITDPLINLVMLMLALPLLVCRDPRAMIPAVASSMVLTGLCMLTAFVCKLVASEPVFGMLMPQFWAWLPIFIFLPISILELDSMKT